MKLWKRTLEEESSLFNAAFISSHTTRRLLQQNPSIWQSSSNRDLVRMLLVRTGTAHIGKINSHPIRHAYFNYIVALSVAVAITVFDNFKPEDDQEVVKQKVELCLAQSNRSLLRFYKTNIDCNCLDELTLQAESNPKFGICRCCSKQFDTSKLFLCGGCKRVQFCSIECQRQNWVDHKKECNGHCRKASMRRINIVCEDTDSRSSSSTCSINTG